MTESITKRKDQLLGHVIRDNRLLRGILKTESGKKRGVDKSRFEYTCVSKLQEIQRHEKSGRR